MTRRKKLTIIILAIALALLVAEGIWVATRDECPDCPQRRSPFDSPPVEPSVFVNSGTVIVTPDVTHRPRETFYGQDAIWVSHLRETTEVILVKCSIPDRNCIVTIRGYKTEPQWVDGEGEQLYQGAPQETWLPFDVEEFEWVTIHRTLAECKCTVLGGSFEEDTTTACQYDSVVA